jgi:hypothetical protein
MFLTMPFPQERLDDAVSGTTTKGRISAAPVSDPATAADAVEECLATGDARALATRGALIAFA